MDGLCKPHQGQTGLDFRRNADSFSCARYTQPVKLLPPSNGAPPKMLMGDPL